MEKQLQLTVEKNGENFDLTFSKENTVTIKNCTKHELEMVTAVITKVIG